MTDLEKYGWVISDKKTEVGYWLYKEFNGVVYTRRATQQEIIELEKASKKNDRP